MGLECSFVCLRPEGLLSRYIRYFWISKAAKSTGSCKYLLLPDGNTEIIFNLGDSERIWNGRNGADWGVYGGSQLIAGRKDPLILEPTGNKYKIGIRFFPGGLYPFFPIPLAEMSNSIVDLGDLLKGDCREMEERLAQAGSVGAVADILQRKMLSRFNPGFQGEKIVARLIQRIHLSRGVFSVNETAKQMGVDPKSLRRKFVAKVGFTPKRFSRIVRFQALVKEVEKKGASAWTSIIYRYGFFDQSHFIKEFEAFSGMTPSRFFSDKIAVVK